MLVQTVLKVYDTFPEMVPAGEKIPPLNFLKNNFDEILAEVGIYDKKEKVIIAALLEPIEEDDLESVTPNETESLLIYIKHLPTQLDENRTVETDAIMKQYFAEFQNEIKQTYFPTNDDGQFTNEVFVLFEPVRSDKVLEEVLTPSEFRPNSDDSSLLLERQLSL
ncbi:hypothetical protein V9T40_002268 [Parthenolecanium corni]|uniref:Uncharacterized protein n=1 Tax=Parthenolecanium corni TaxID=536013 RepID=A0AAN9Y586_9HEMI